MIGFLRKTLGTFLLTLLVLVAYSTAMVCLWGFMLDYLSPRGIRHRGWRSHCTSCGSCSICCERRRSPTNGKSP